MNIKQYIKLYLNKNEKYKEKNDISEFKLNVREICNEIDCWKKKNIECYWYDSGLSVGENDIKYMLFIFSFKENLRINKIVNFQWKYFKRVQKFMNVMYFMDYLLNL